MACSLERWVGKVAIVTGASVGIGAAIAVTLVNHGINVSQLCKYLDNYSNNPIFITYKT